MRMLRGYALQIRPDFSAGYNEAPHSGCAGTRNSRRSRFPFGRIGFQITLRKANARDRTSRLWAFDHYHTRCLPPCFSFVFYFAAKCSGRRSVGLHPSGWELTPTDPGCLARKFDSDDFLQDPSDALLDRLGSLCRDFLSEAPKFHILRGCDVEVLARLPG